MNPPISQETLGKMEKAITVLEGDVAILKGDVRDLRKWRFKLTGALILAGVFLPSVNLFVTLWLGRR